MSWALLLGVVGALGFSLFVALARRSELTRMAGYVEERERALRQGSAQAQLQHPVVDLSRCLGCATCVAACPEDGVLEIVHGQAVVVNGARCVGVSACERECPVGAITVTLGNLSERNDVPVLTGHLESPHAPGLFLAGEVTAHALIKTAVEHGTLVADEVAQRLNGSAGAGGDVLDLVIVGAGPAGLACALQALAHGLRFVMLEQEQEIGGTVAKYPRQKLVLTQPVDLPLGGRLDQPSYTKEELMEMWRALAQQHALPMVGGVEYQGLERAPGGHYVVHGQAGAWAAHHVCLALGRRGTPRKLGVPGEQLPKVAYSLLDAGSYQGRRVLVVGGGDSAVEAALGLAQQPGNQVTLSYRKEAFFRIRKRNEERLREAVAAKRVSVLFESEVLAIHPESVELAVNGSGGPPRFLPNDDVFVMAGGVAPLQLLERSGVSFDPTQHAPQTPLVEQGTGLVPALKAGFGLSVAALAFALWNLDYYALPTSARPAHLKHVWLRPGMGAGLAFGIAATVLVVLNLLYVVRRSPRFRLQLGSLQLWMTSHVATGILAFLCALLHAAMAPRDTVGGHAFWALLVLLVTGAIGRYVYAWVPRAANGRELELEEVHAALEQRSEEFEPGQRSFHEKAREEVFALVKQRQWKASLPGRLLAWAGLRRDLRKLLADIAERGRERGVPEEQVQETLALARSAHRSALVAAHYEDLRGLLSSWRWLHRWVAALMVLLVLLHVVNALLYGSFFFGGGDA